MTEDDFRKKMREADNYFEQWDNLVYLRKKIGKNKTTWKNKIM